MLRSACLAAVALVLVVAAPVAATPPARGAATAAASAAPDVGWAEDQVGLAEDGTSNCSREINRWQRQMDLRVPPCRPWCGAFVHQAVLRGGVKLSGRMIDPDKAYDDIRANRRHLQEIPVRSVRRGDIVLFKLRSGVRHASHIELVRGRPGSDDRIPLVGGNVSHRVEANRRGIQYVAIAARVVP